MCDPIFLCDKARYEALADMSERKLPERYILNFLLDPNDEKVDAYRFVQKSLGIAEVVNLTDLQDVARRVERFGTDGAYGDAEIEDFVKAYKEAAFVITDSFHGTCLAVILNKPFIAIVNKQRGEKRFVSLMNWLGLNERFVFDIDEIYHNAELLSFHGFEEANEIIRQGQIQGCHWLKRMLEKAV